MDGEHNGTGERGTTCSIVVLDSGDGAPSAALAALWSEARPACELLVVDAVGAGYARAFNRACRRATGEELVLLGPGVMVDEGCIEALLRALWSAPDVGVVGGRAHTAEGARDATCAPRRPSLVTSLAFALGREWSDPWRPGPTRAPGVVTASVVSGGVLAIRRQVWDLLGGFDESFPLHGYDIDLCLRAATAGLRTVVALQGGYRRASEGPRALDLRWLQRYRGERDLYRRELPGPSARVAVAALQMGTLVRLGASMVPRGPTRRRRRPGP